MGITTSCPLPSNINPLSSNGFILSITKLPDVTFFCQEANLPAMNLQSIDVMTPLSTVPFASDNLAFEDLVVEFLIDEDMKNYTSIYNWMVGLGFPRQNEQYANFIDQQTVGFSRSTKESSDAVLQILGSNLNPVKVIRFFDIIPVSLSSLNFQSTTTDVNYLTGSATFRINRYEFE